MKDVTFSKWIIRIALIQGFAMMWASYALALFNRAQIAETLSKTVCIEVVAVVLGYYAKAGMENLSKNNNWPDRPERKVPVYDSTDQPGGGFCETTIPTTYASDSDTSLSQQPGY
jgi:hypothetical protein